ncbi:lipopolysaccharide-induced tumor necrosis factor-alpha factor homolog [Triplophysa rosa]|uniref:Lipopolysaccharide-induced TNF factor n=1 Tax=Triplophysa rosa TaxID=992332 RepID=A0A9W7TTK2_TRIRA|nr:lipopolysaccharide-induced tumor necrosis factor-alpha factor homolog [Triplophysa rosa]KAI7803075.1 lipopolysaccharide-induced TNF factor [Triplophysa rosa]
MASAPPFETSSLVGYPPPPPYEETMGTVPQYTPGPMPYPQTDVKATQPPYPQQAYGQMYPPPPPQAQPVTTPVVSVQTVYVQSGVVFRDTPVLVHCPVCTQHVTSQLEYTSGALTWLSCAGLAIFGCFYGCCLIPFCVNSLKDVTHRCPSCHRTLGVYTRI